MAHIHQQPAGQHSEIVQTLADQAAAAAGRGERRRRLQKGKVQGTAGSCWGWWLSPSPGAGHSTLLLTDYHPGLLSTCSRLPMQRWQRSCMVARSKPAAKAVPQGAACRHLRHLLPSSRLQAHPHLGLAFLGGWGLRLSSGGGRWPQDTPHEPRGPRNWFVARRTCRARL